MQHMAAGLGAVLVGGVESARGYAANDTIHVACLGTGGRCRHLMERLAKIPNVRLVGVADVWDHHLELGRRLADGSAVVDKDYHRLLDRSDVDAVLIGSPDHWHVQMTVDACGAGKDVYVEKPLTHALDEGARVIDAQNRNGRIVQVGTQQRSIPHLIEARELARSGVLGQIHKIQLTWNRNVDRWDRSQPKIDEKSVDWQAFLGSAPKQPYDSYRFRNWRWFWDFGGGIFTDLMVHWIDTAYWILDMHPPEAATSIGDHFRTEGLWETPDTVQTLLRYSQDRLQAHFEGTFVNHHNRAMLEIMGDRATLYLDRGRYELLPERHRGVEAREKIAGQGERGLDFFPEVDCGMFHLSNWVSCIRSRERPNCPAEEGVRSAAAAHLANIALRTGQTALWQDHVPRSTGP
jgi:predicted dehydrogenase